MVEMVLKGIQVPQVLRVKMAVLGTTDYLGPQVQGVQPVKEAVQVALDLLVVVVMMVRLELLGNLAHPAPLVLLDSPEAQDLRVKLVPPVPAALMVLQEEEENPALKVTLVALALLAHLEETDPRVEKVKWVLLVFLVHLD